jgi:transcriptional regulator with XRE-family HTH domain
MGVKNEEKENRERSVLIGERLKIAREAAGLSQAALAERVGIGRLAIIKAEKGETPLRSDVIAQVCDVLQADAGFVLGVHAQGYVFEGVVHYEPAEEVVSFPAPTGQSYYRIENTAYRA